jgi:uncharacterized protein YbjT (DUF2867 family)
MYVITAATGNTGKLIAKNLLEAGKPVKVIGRSAERLAELTALGAVPAVGDLSDTNFLTQTFEGATAVYLVIPPKMDATDWTAYQRSVSNAFVDALKISKVQKAVVLSSLGAHLPEGAGPVSRLGELEHALQSVPNLDVLNLRPGFFMENFFGQADLIRHAGIIGYNLKADVPMPLTHTRDIAEVATRHLLKLDFQGQTHEDIGGAADLTMAQVAEVLGKSIGKPDLTYVAFENEAARAGMVQNGLPQTIADGYVELFDAINNGEYLNEYKRTPQNTSPTTLEWFAENQFKYAFN